MAVAARPGPSDARVPCPLCGGLIHPIAGKCKHCKADLTGYHAARPAASTPLPALHRPSNGHAPHAQANGHPAHAAVATAVAAAEAQPVLPPRPTAPSHAAEPATSAWRSWPVLVIVIAMLAIIAAVVLMMWPESSARGGDRKRALPPPPAPEHMPTTVPDPRTAPNRQSQAPRANPDPWATPSDPPAKDPGGKPDATDDSTDAADSTDDDDLAPLKDPFADSHASRSGLRFNRPGALFGTMVVHVCRKMLECGVADPLVTNQCERFSRVLPQPPPQCPAATRCFQHIDAMACGTQPATLAHVATLLNQFIDCHDAIRC
ncbi:MAG TPA: hypothetical protein VLM79_40280 [Kofleriaceae bacterium]|nr:hypothetical protein [Kofleriaceae bacterium]